MATTLMLDTAIAAAAIIGESNVPATGWTSNAMSNDISSYRADSRGNLSLLQSIAAPADELPAPFVIPADLTLSSDSPFLYVRNVQDGDLRAFSIGSDGSLTLVQMLPIALPSGAIGVASS
ncbi:MAG: lactonase family protein, partial [Actinomycetota bacterium]|nr:lactonase family protein [Actinomycetota bacterium]